MAEAAAPAPAPSSGAPAAAADAAAEAQPVPGGEVDAPAAPGPDKVERLAKPIRPIPPLPGVFPDDDPFPAASSSPADSSPSSGDRPRGPDGRFLASPSTPVVGEPASEQRDEPIEEPFIIDGETYKSRAAFEQNFKSLRGNFKPLQAIAKQLGGMDKIVPTLSEAAASARGWKEAHDRLKAELEGRSGQPVATQSSKQDADPAAESEKDSVDWELYAEVKKLANQSGEPWKAEQWLIEQVRKGERSRVDKLLTEKFAPIADAQSKLQFVAKTEKIFQSLADYTLDNGSPAFPELSDPAAAHEIGRLWTGLGLPPEAALTPQGAIAAIAMYRMRSRPQASPASAPAPARALPPPPGPADTHAAADMGDGKPMPMSSGDGATPSAEAARIIAGLRSVNNGSRAHLGFEP